MNQRDVLQSGALLGEYRIESVLGAGGFGVTYRALDTAQNRLVAIKEYYPTDLAVRDASGRLVAISSGLESELVWGRNRFNEEARTLLQFRHPNIVQLFKLLQFNNSAYMVLSFEPGMTLRQWVKRLGRPVSQAELDALLEPLLAALELIHSNGILHRDLSPDNILIRENQTPVIIDFGSARHAVGQRGALSAIVKHGFSPHEQYATDSLKQGPWSDIYALAATMFFVITGRAPPQAVNRLERDNLGQLMGMGLSAYRPSFLGAIDSALAISQRQRPQSVRSWRTMLFADRVTQRFAPPAAPPVLQFSPPIPHVAPSPAEAFPAFQSPPQPPITTGQNQGPVSASQGHLTERPTKLGGQIARRRKAAGLLLLVLAFAFAGATLVALLE